LSSCSSTWQCQTYRPTYPSKPANLGSDEDDATGEDISLNFVPVMYPLYMPAVMTVEPHRREFWRVLNASADTYFDLQVITVENGKRVSQKLELIAVDGAAAGEGANSMPRTSILLSPGARAEFILTTANAGAFSHLVSRAYDTGPDGAANRHIVIANIISGKNIPGAKRPNAEALTPKTDSHFAGLANIRPVHVRKLYFSEDREDLRTPGKPAKYFITVEGKTPTVFDMNFKKPDISVRQGTVEDWVIENGRASPMFFTFMNYTSNCLSVMESRRRNPCCATPSTFRSGPEKNSTPLSGCGWISGPRKSWAHFSFIATFWSMRTRA
jgi:hypothetical protein